MKTNQMNNVTIHGFDDWHPTFEEWNGMMNVVLLGANRDCDATVLGVKKTMKEWQDIFSK